MALSDREFDFTWTWTLPASPEELWPLVSDTERFNRDTGLPPVVDAREDGEELENARRKLRLSIHGVPIEWEETPFEWVRPRRFGVVRRYARGPVAEMRVLAELEPLDDDATELTYRVAARPAGLPGLLAIPFQIGFLSRRTFGRVFREYGDAAAALRKAEDRSSPADPPPALPTGRERRRASVGRRLAEAGVGSGVAAALGRHVATADDLTVSRIRPYVLADLWTLSRKEMLEACLRATRAGILNMRWDVLCPLCRGVKEDAASLRDLRHRGVHCDTCGIDFGGDFERSVELTFRPAPTVREVGEARFCVAGPQVTPHVLVQQRLEPGEERVVRPSLEPGRHRVRLHGEGAGLDFDVATGAEEVVVAFELGVDGWSGGAERLGLRPVLSLRNRTERERLVLLERTPWTDGLVTAAEVIRLPAFRDLFSREVLAVGDFVEVGTLAVLFTDLKASTRLYRTLGDAPAFGRVMEHFDVLREAVDSREGTVVKTIGDAVMAVFPTAGDAVAAALAAHRRLERAAAAVQEGRAGSLLVLKAGVHLGPCLVVTQNERLDYFGSTVNVAARLGDLSEGGDVVVSHAVRGDPGVEALLRSTETHETSLEVSLRGLEDELRTVWRIRPAPVAAGRSEGAGPDRGAGP